jgi:hypothetical protein
LSAAAIVPLPQPTSPVRNVCKTPLSYFQYMLEGCNYTQLKVFGAVLVNTIGRTHPETWAEISDEQFEDAVGVTKEWWSLALETLTAYSTATGKPSQRVIRTRKSPTSGRIQYALTENLATETRALTVRGKCLECKAIGAFETEFVPVPHAVYRKLGAALDHASFVCLMVIIRHSLQWTGERGVWGEPTQLDINDFERATELSPRSISAALAKLCDPDGWALVDRTERKGRPALYRAIPERFGKIDRRDARVVVMPTPNREKKGNTTPAGLHEIVPESGKPTAIESAPHYYGFCKACGHYGEVEPCEEVESSDPLSKSPPRAGPGRETRPPAEQVFSNFKTFKGF